ncbi:MAG: undecaprenyl-diphosphate phosphatase [Pseudomonadota bacterium]
MPLFHLLLLAVIQGVTEFLPVSSSGHLALYPRLTNVQDQGLALDVAVHVGSLLAVILYFWKDVKLAMGGLIRLARGKIDTQGAFLALCLVVSTIPVVAVGFVLYITGWSDALRSMAVIGWAMLIFGVVLYWADRSGGTERIAARWTLKDAAVMGLAQVLALIPGTSRSGITITAARKLGYDRESSARLAMLMSIPTIVASGVLLVGDAVDHADVHLLRDATIAAAFSFLSALLALAFMMRLLKAVSYTPYVIYRCVFGIVLLVIAYS